MASGLGEKNSNSFFTFRDICIYVSGKIINLHYFALIDKPYSYAVLRLIDILSISLFFIAFSAAQLDSKL